MKARSRPGGPSSAVPNHAMVAELLHAAGPERGFDGGLDRRDMAAFVTSHAGVGREHRGPGKAVIGAGRALTDCAEDEISGHDGSWHEGRVAREPRAVGGFVGK